MDSAELKIIFDFNWKLPIVVDGVIWNGKPDKWINIKNHGLYMSQRFAMNMVDYGQFGLKGHNGVDIAGTINTPVVAPIEMFISEIITEDEDKGYGNTIWAESRTRKLNGVSYKIQLVFGHFSSLVITSAGWVKQGTIIGYIGSTGFSTGPHLHLGLRPLILDFNTKNWEQIFFNNGYRGYTDPEIFLPYMTWDYQELINQDKFMSKQEKKIIIEGEGVGRKGIIINGKLREIKNNRASEACLYALANNGFGKTIDSKAFDLMPKDKDF